MGDKWLLTEEQLRRLLLVTHVVIGAPITEESRDEASTCFERQRAENCTQQHEDDEISAKEQIDNNA